MNSTDREERREKRERERERAEERERESGRERERERDGIVLSCERQMDDVDMTQAQAQAQPESCPVTVAVHVRPLLETERNKFGTDVSFRVHQQCGSDVSKRHLEEEREEEEEIETKTSSSKSSSAGRDAEAAEFAGKKKEKKKKKVQQQQKLDLLNVDDGKYLFEYDYVYSDSSMKGRSPSTMYSDCVEPLVQGLFGGYSATVLAYGQTGSGKTYTMGSLDTAAECKSNAAPIASSRAPSREKGIIPRAVDTLYERIEKEKREGGKDVKVKVSYVEIYNEEIRDLLACGGGGGSNDDQNHHQSLAQSQVCGGGDGLLQRKNSGNGNSKQQEIHIRESSDGCVHLIGCSEVEVKDRRHMGSLFQKGLQLRSTSQTGMNKQSSRSHAIFTILVETREEVAETKNKSENGEEATGEKRHEILRGKMHLVDLAGSERVKRTLAEGSTFKEGVNINKGLLALGNVISALASDSSAVGDSSMLGDAVQNEMPTHVPYRDSKLTRILRDALGGNSKTVMIACVAPSIQDCDESVNTLRYAQRARSITNVVTKDTLDGLDKETVEALREALKRTRAENTLLKKQLCLCKSEVSTLKSIIKFGTQKASNILQPELRNDNNIGLGQIRSSILKEEGAHEENTTRGNALESGVEVDENLQAKGKSSCQTEADDFDSLNTLESRVSKLDEALIEKERAMQQVRRGVNQMHQQLVKSCVSDKNEVGHPLELSKDGASGESANMNGRAEIPCTDDSLPNNNEMQNLVSSMESEIGALQVQKLELLQQLQEYTEVSDASLKEQGASSDARSGKSARSRKKSKNNGDSAKESRQKQILMDKVKRLESILSELKQKHAKLVGLERLKKKSDALCDRLNKDMEEIKRQKCQLVREINMKSKKFQSFQRNTKKEMLSLQREKSKAEQARSKLEMNKEKQKQALKRKTEECNRHKNKLKQLTRKDSRNSSDDGNNKYHNAKEVNDVPEFQPNALAPLLRDERSRQVWIEEEIEACTLLEKIRDALKETHSDTVECSQCIKVLKNKSRVLERKIDKSKRKSNSSSTSSEINGEYELWESELEQSKSQLSTMESSKKDLNERMASLEVELGKLMHKKAASFMLTGHSAEDMSQDGHPADSARKGDSNSSINLREAHRLAKVLISGKQGMNTNGMSSDLRRWSGLRSLAEARGMLRIVFSKAVDARIEMIESNKALEALDVDSRGKEKEAESQLETNSDSDAPVEICLDKDKRKVAEEELTEQGNQQDCKKHSYVDQKWIDDILKEQEKHLSMLTQWGRGSNKSNSKSSDSDLARKALEKYKKKENKKKNKKKAAEDENPRPSSGRISESRETQPASKTSPKERIRYKDLRKSKSWQETKKVIDNVLEKRRKRMPFKTTTNEIIDLTELIDIVS